MATKIYKDNWDFRAEHLSDPPSSTAKSPCADDASRERPCAKCNESHRELMSLILNGLKPDNWCFMCRFDHCIQSLIDDAGDHPSGDRDSWITDMGEKERRIIREFALSQMRTWIADNIKKHGLQLTDQEQASMEHAITGNRVTAPNDSSYFQQDLPIRQANPDAEPEDPPPDKREAKRQIPFLADRPKLPKGTKLSCRDCKYRRSFQWFSTEKPASSNKCVVCRFKKTLRRSKARYKPKGPNASLKKCLLKCLESNLANWRRWVGKHKHGFIKDSTEDKIQNLLTEYIESHLLSRPASTPAEGVSSGGGATGEDANRAQEAQATGEDATANPSAADTTRKGSESANDVVNEDDGADQETQSTKKRTASTSLAFSAHLPKAPRLTRIRTYTPGSRDSSIEIIEELSTAPASASARAQRKKPSSDQTSQTPLRIGGQHAKASRSAPLPQKSTNGTSKEHPEDALHGVLSGS